MFDLALILLLTGPRSLYGRVHNSRDIRTPLGGAGLPLLVGWGALTGVSPILWPFLASREKCPPSYGVVRFSALPGGPG